MEEVTRPLLTLHVFGSQGCGKTTLKKQWFESSHCKVLSEIADVHIRIQVGQEVGEKNPNIAFHSHIVVSGCI